MYSDIMLWWVIVEISNCTKLLVAHHLQSLISAHHFRTWERFLFHFRRSFEKKETCISLIEAAGELIKNGMRSYFLVISFLPFANVVDVDVRLGAPFIAPLLNDMDEIDEKLFGDALPPKKSSINETPINGFMNDVNSVLFCGCEWRLFVWRRLPLIPMPTWPKSSQKQVDEKIYTFSVRIPTDLALYSTTYRQRIDQQMVSSRRKTLGTLRLVNGIQSQNQNLRNHGVEICVCVHYDRAGHLCHTDRIFGVFSLYFFLRTRKKWKKKNYCYSSIICLLLMKSNIIQENKKQKQKKNT